MRAFFFTLLISALVVSITVLLLLRADRVRMETFNFVTEKMPSPDLLILGDSMLYRETDWYQRFDLPFWQVHNAAIGGYEVRQIFTRLKDGLATKPLCVVMIMGGINRRPEDTAEFIFGDYQSLLDLIMARGGKPIILETLYRSGTDDDGYVQELNHKLAEYSQEKGVLLVKLNQNLSDNKALKASYTTDGLHLTPEGYNVMGATIKQQAGPLIEKQLAACKSQ